MVLGRRTTTSSSRGSAPNPDEIVSARAVVKTYTTGKERFQALRGIDFTVRRGEMVTRSAPAPLRVMLLATVSALVPVAPEPSR